MTEAYDWARKEGIVAPIIIERALDLEKLLSKLKDGIVFRWCPSSRFLPDLSEIRRTIRVVVALGVPVERVRRLVASGDLVALPGAGDLRIPQASVRKLLWLEGGAA